MYHLRLAKFELVAVFAQHVRHLATQQPHVDRAGRVRDCARRLINLDCIARVQHRQVRHPAHDRQILSRLMTGAVPSGQTGQRAANFDRQVFLGNCHGDEVVGAARCEHGVSRGERHEALTRQTGGGRH